MSHADQTLCLQGERDHWAGVGIWVGSSVWLCWDSSWRLFGLEGRLEQALVKALVKAGIANTPSVYTWDAVDTVYSMICQVPDAVQL